MGGRNSLYGPDTIWSFYTLGRLPGSPYCLAQRGSNTYLSHQRMTVCNEGEGAIALFQRGTLSSKRSEELAATDLTFQKRQTQRAR